MVCCQQLRQDKPLKLTYLIEEEVDKATFVGNVTKDAELWRKFSSPDWLKDVYFSLDSPQSAITSFLDITSSGVIFTNSPIDREQFCARKIKCDIPLTVHVQATELYMQIPAILSIIDVDDNAPFFNPANITRLISEAAPVGSRLSLPLADDLDSPAFSPNRYEIIGSSKFSLRQTDSSDGGVEEVSLLLTSSLDREAVDNYNVMIIAYDSSSSRGSLDCHIIVTDVNDNGPMFERNIYEIDVSEDKNVGDVMIELKATDRDAGANGRITYRLSAKSSMDYGDLFSVNYTTGIVSLLKPLDYEQVTEYSLTIVAQDSGALPETAMTKVVIHVVDVNDNEPLVSIVSLVGGCPDCGNNIYLPVVAPVGTIVASLRVIDQDSGSNGAFTCQVTAAHQSARGYFGLENNASSNIAVILQHTVDQLPVTQLPFDVSCEDRGIPSRKASQTFIVNIISNSAPRFGRPEFTGTIAENNFPDTIVMQVTAVDVDSGSYSRIRYDLDPDEKDAGKIFSIDSNLGIVRTRVSLNREQKDRYRFKIIASDHGQPPLSSVAFVNVIVTDVNDMAPKFHTPTFSFVVQENQPAGVCIGQLSAQDEDLGPYNRYRFSVEPPNSDFFNVDSGGNLCTLKSFDREMMQLFKLLVKVTDMADSNLYSVADVIVTIADANDNKPDVVFPSSYNDTIFIHRNMPSNKLVVGRILARDVDLGVNGFLTYAIISGNEEGLFYIEDNTGTIRTNKPITMEMGPKEVTLEIAITDSGTPSLRSSVLLRISINISAYLAAAGLDGTNIKIIIAIATVMGMIAVVLLIAIVTVVRTKKRRHNGCSQASLPPAIKDKRFSQADFSQFPVSNSALVDVTIIGKKWDNDGIMTELLEKPSNKERQYSLSTFSEASCQDVFTRPRDRPCTERDRRLSCEQRQRLLMVKHFVNIFVFRTIIF